MAEYRIRETGAVVTESEFRALHPNTSFPTLITVEMLDDYGADPVLEGAQPTHSEYQVVYRDGVEEMNGQWFTKYAVADMDEEAVAAVKETKRASNKAEASRRLAETDYTQLPDAAAQIENSMEIAAYRAALRAIAVNPPETVEEWPNKPETVWK